MIVLIISQVNFLICTVDDYLDLGRIQRNQFKHENKIFVPAQTTKFISGVFKHQLELAKKSLTFQVVDRDEDHISITSIRHALN